MEDIQAFFRDHKNYFTIYVVESKFAANRGADYFKYYRGKPNYIDSDYAAKSFISKIIGWIGKNIPSIAKLLNNVMTGLSPTNVVEIVEDLSKLFGTQEHQAAGPNVIDPIIIQEGKVIKKYINTLVTLHKDSPYAPAIIIILRDNDFDRAKLELSNCPDGTFIKFIKNSGECVLHKVINTGSEDIDGFINSFSQQCFSTCSSTKHDILLNNEWYGNSLIKEFTPRLLKYRADLICDNKNKIKQHLTVCINEIQHRLKNNPSLTSHDETLLKSFLCISKLYNVFCNDFGGPDLNDALKLAKELDNEIMQAYAYKLSYFFDNKNLSEQEALLQHGYEIFKKNQMLDNALYCRNNMLVRQIDTNNINIDDFDRLVGDATSEVPGLVGMSHILNNAGVAFMTKGRPEAAIEQFNKGLDFSHSAARSVQELAIRGNILITKSYYKEDIDNREIYKLVLRIFDSMVNDNKLPFISSRYIMNLLIIAAKNNINFAKELLNDFDISGLFKQGLTDNKIGSGQLLMQIEYIRNNYPELDIINNNATLINTTDVTGHRRKMIESSGLNPFYFCTWL